MRGKTDNGLSVSWAISQLKTEKNTTEEMKKKIHKLGDNICKYKGLISKIYRGLLQFNKKMKINPLFKRY